MGCHQLVRWKYFLVIVISLFVNSSYACQGHNFHVNYIKNCGDIKAPVISVVENSTLELTPECVVIPNACAETKAFGAAKMKYKIWKSNLVVLQGDLDGCERLQKVNDDVKSMLTMFGMPTKCPIEAMKKCEDGSKKAEVLERFRKFIALARGGPIRVEVKIEHDTGKSCVAAEFEVTKK